MAEFDDILQRYGEGYRDPRLGMDSADYSTRDVLNRMHDQPWFTKAMRHLASYLPTDDREDRQRGRDEPWMNWWARTNLDSGAGPALTSAVKGGLNSGANWLEGKPKIGPDTLAPLGMAAMGMQLTRAAAMAKPQAAALERPERPVRAAMKIGDNIYQGSNHGLALAKAEQALGSDALWSQWNKKNGFGPDSEGFVTNKIDPATGKGRYVSRQEATDLLGQYREYPGELHASSLNVVRRNERYKNNPDLLADSSRASLPGVLVNAAEQKQAPRYTLSENLALPGDLPRSRPTGDPFYYHVLRDGDKIGSARGSVADNIAYLSWLGSTGLDNTLGPAGIRQLREAMRRDFPKVDTFEGHRSSGARAPDLGSKLSADRLQSVKLRSDVGLPGTVVDMLKQYGETP